MNYTTEKHKQDTGGYNRLFYPKPNHQIVSKVLNICRSYVLFEHNLIHKRKNLFYFTILNVERFDHYNAYKFIPNKQECIFSHVISMVYR